VFPALYHLQHSRYNEDIPFWLELSSQQSGPILELGCGTGRVMTALASTGRQVIGLDNDREMLAYLLQHLSPPLSITIHYFQADMAHFHLAQRFGLILLPCNTYSTFSATYRQAVLACLGRHLLPGGMFAVSLPNPSLLQRLPIHGQTEIEDILVHPSDGEPVQVSSAWQRTRDHFLINWHYDHLLSDGTVQRLSVQIRHHLTETSIYLGELQGAGFETIRLYGDFNRENYKPDSPQLIITASWPGT
jgi:SAM-dependent methyltransferase